MAGAALFQNYWHYLWILLTFFQIFFLLVFTIIRNYVSTEFSYIRKVHLPKKWSKNLLCQFWKCRISFLIYSVVCLLCPWNSCSINWKKRLLFLLYTPLTHRVVWRKHKLKEYAVFIVDVLPGSALQSWYQGWIQPFWLGITR